MLPQPQELVREPTAMARVRLWEIWYWYASMESSSRLGLVPATAIACWAPARRPLCYWYAAFDN